VNTELLSKLVELVFFL